MDNEKVNEAMKKGTAQAQAVYAKGNELMDRVSFLRNPLYKKIVWGVVGLVVLLLLGRIFGCGSSQSPFDVAKEAMVAMFSGDDETFIDHLYIPSEDGNTPSREDLRKLAPMLLEKIRPADIDDADNAAMKELLIEMLESMEEKSTEINGDEATVTVVTKMMGKEEEKKIKLRKQAGEWKFDPTTF